MKIEVAVDSPVVIKLDDKEVKLTREEAKELLEKLGAALEEKVVYIPHYIPSPYTSPWIRPWTWGDMPKITWTGTNTSGETWNGTFHSDGEVCLF